MRALTLLISLLISSVSYAQSEYYNPIDGKTYVGDWKKYESENGTKEEKGRVINLGVRLMNTDADLRKNITAEGIASLVRSIEGIFTENVKDYNDAGEVLIQVTVDKNTEPDFKISFQGELKKEYLQKSKDALSTLEYQTKESSITFQVHLKIKNA